MLGPVIKREVKSLPKVMSIGTTDISSIRGCLAEFRVIYFSSFNKGFTPFIFLE